MLLYKIRYLYIGLFLSRFFNLFLIGIISYSTYIIHYITSQYSTVRARSFFIHSFIYSLICSRSLSFRFLFTVFELSYTLHYFISTSLTYIFFFLFYTTTNIFFFFATLRHMYITLISRLSIFNYSVITI